MQAVVAGSTGHVGKVLTKKLTETDQIDMVLALSRSGDLWNHPKIAVEHIDYIKEKELVSGLSGKQLVFCCLGTTMKRAGSKEAFRLVDYEYVRQLIKASEKAGIEQFHLISAMGSSLNSPFYYSRVKAEIESVLKASTIPVKIIYQPGLLGGKREEYRFGEKVAQIIADLVQPLMVGPLFQYRQVGPEVLSDCMIQQCLKAEKGLHVVAARDILRS